PLVVPFTPARSTRRGCPGSAGDGQAWPFVRDMADNGGGARCYFSRGVQQVLVLNASFEPLNVCSVRRAHVLVYKGKAEVIEGLDRPFRSATASFVWPSVIRLSVYVRVPRAAQRKISRRALFARDAWTCVYW